MKIWWFKNTALLLIKRVTIWLVVMFVMVIVTLLSWVLVVLLRVLLEVVKGGWIGREASCHRWLLHGLISGILGNKVLGLNWLCRNEFLNLADRLYIRSETGERGELLLRELLLVSGVWNKSLRLECSGLLRISWVVSIVITHINI